MKINELYKSAEKLPQETREALLELIDLKTDSSMKEVLSALSNLSNNQENTAKAIAHLERNTNKSIENLEKNFKIIYWLIGSVITIMIALKLIS